MSGRCYHGCEVACQHPLVWDPYLRSPTWRIAVGGAPKPCYWCNQVDERCVHRSHLNGKKSLPTLAELAARPTFELSYLAPTVRNAFQVGSVGPGYCLAPGAPVCFDEFAGYLRLFEGRPQRWANQWEFPPNYIGVVAEYIESEDVVVSNDGFLRPAIAREPYIHGATNVALPTFEHLGDLVTWPTFSWRVSDA